ncbi:MAG: hypothetical protein M3300_07870, partial [Actinomycetota bacterium]|nr:hypothetical protein [Actinomycetota bacterium]
IGSDRPLTPRHERGRAHFRITEPRSTTGVATLRPHTHQRGVAHSAVGLLSEAQGLVERFLCPLICAM